MSAAAAMMFAVALGQAQVAQPLRLDRGAIAGRVCSDTDGDGRCQAEEPGLVGVRVMLETGFWAVTDANGAYHFADVPGRTPEREGTSEVRLVLGRHRIKVDPLTLQSGAQVVPNGATLELPMGGVVTQDFAVAPFARAGATAARASGVPPGGRFADGGLQVRLSGQVGEGETVIVAGRPAEVGSDGVYRAWVPLSPGPHRVPVQVSGKGNRTGFFVQQVDVVERGGSFMVVPRALEAVGTVTVLASAATGRSISVEAPPQTRVRLADVEVAVPPSGQTTVALGESQEPRIPVVLVSAEGVTVTGEVSLEPPSGLTAVGLLDVEGAFVLGAGGGFRFAGRGAGAVRGRLLGFDLAAELDLRDADIRALQNGGASSFFLPRRNAVAERALPIVDVVPQWADDSASVAPNAPESRLRVEISREGVGRLGFGTYRAWLGAGNEIGRFHRSMTGAYLEARTPDDAVVGGGVRGFYAPGGVDPVGGLARVPAHDRFEATGGSLFYLSGPAVEGSEAVRVELRDGVTGLPIGERHLTRGVDYSIDPIQGRILLARPLWSFESTRGLGAGPPSNFTRPVLWVDYERPVVGPSERTFGGEVSGRLGPVTLNAGYAEQGGARLLRGSASGWLGPVLISAEVARSFDVTDISSLRWSDDGGLTFTSASGGLAPVRGAANAFGLRARGPALFYRGSFDVSWRYRDQGFFDAQHYDPIAFRQIAARVEQPIGDFVVGGVFDDRWGADAHLPPSNQRIAGGFVGWERPTWGIRLEGRDATYRALDDGIEGGRVSVGLSARWAVTSWLTLRAAHRQRVWSHGAGLGAFDDTFASAGVDLRPSQDVTLALRGGWGPVIGPQVWGNVQVRRGDEVWYGGHSLDVDAPSLGERRLASGVRRELDSGAVFVEDVSAHDITGLRLSRAVGLTQRVTEGLSISARYERGVRMPVELAPDRERDAGGVGLSFVSERARAWLRGEVRSERRPGDELLQGLAWGGGELSITQSLRATLSATFSHTSRNRVLEARLLEGVAALAWRFEPGIVVLRYSMRRELLPPSRGGGAEYTRHLVSVLPSVTLFSRLRISGGAHLQLHQVEGAPLDIQLVASLRPSFRIWSGLEVAAEVGRRSADPDGEGLTTLRGEVGFRYSGFLVAGGYTMLGYRASPMDPAATNQGRIYLRAEMAY